LFIAFYFGFRRPSASFPKKKYCPKQLFCIGKQRPSKNKAGVINATKKVGKKAGNF
jgi:hypothetical protein